MAELHFDASTVTPDSGQLDAIPAGWYNAAMDQSEMKPTKDGSGAYLECRFNVLDGQHAGRKLFARLNLRNANPVAQEIAYKQLSAICHAVGRINIQDTSQLHDIPLKLKVKLRPAQGEYEASNEITAFKNANEAVGTQPAMAPAATAAPAIPQAAPQQPQQQWQQPAQQPAQAPQAAQPWQQPQGQQQAAPAPAQQPQQPWQGQPQQQPPAGVPAPVAGAEQGWQQPAAQQPWQQGAPAGAPAAAPQQQEAPMTQQPAAMQVPEGFNPQGATPPWQQPQQ